MSKTLSTILTIFKVVKIIAKVVFILCIIGGAGCLIGLATLPMAAVFAEEYLDLSSAYLGCFVGAAVCAAEAVFAFFAARYFDNVLKAGTPFTLEGSKEIFRLGIASIIISVACAIIVGVASFVFVLIADPTMDAPDVNMSISLSTGLVFLFLSLIFKHGAELQAPIAQEPRQEIVQEPKQEEQGSASEGLAE